MRIGNQVLGQNRFLNVPPPQSSSREERHASVSKVACLALSEQSNLCHVSFSSSDLDVSKEDSGKPKSPPKENKWPNPFKRPTKPLRPIIRPW